MPRRPFTSVAGAVAVLALLVACGGSGRSLASPHLTGAAATTCTSLVGHLPTSVADQRRDSMAKGSKYVAAWGDPAIQLVCGVGRPKGFGRASSCLTVNGVDWYVPPAQLDAESDLTMTVVNRDVYVQVFLPGTYFPPATAMADLAAAIKAETKKTGACV